MRSIVVVTLAIVALTVGGCSTPKKHKAAAPIPQMQEEAPKADKDSHFEDVRKAASEQLECPIEQVNVVCVRRDTEGECIAVRADGCEKTFEYQFGDG